MSKAADKFNQAMTNVWLQYFDDLERDLIKCFKMASNSGEYSEKEIDKICKTLKAFFGFQKCIAGMDYAKMFGKNIK